MELILGPLIHLGIGGASLGVLLYVLAVVVPKQQDRVQNALLSLIDRHEAMLTKVKDAFEEALQAQHDASDETLRALDRRWQKSADTHAEELSGVKEELRDLRRLIELHEELPPKVSER